MPISCFIWPGVTTVILVAFVARRTPLWVWQIPMAPLEWTRSTVMYALIYPGARLGTKLARARTGRIATRISGVAGYCILIGLTWKESWGPTTPLFILGGLYAALITHEIGHAVMYRSQDFMVTSMQFGLPAYGKTTAVGDRRTADLGLIAMGGLGLNWGASGICMVLFASGWRVAIVLALTQWIIGVSALFPSSDLRLSLEQI